MPRFRIVTDEEAQQLLQRPNTEVYIEELRRHRAGEWVIAELGDDENKESVKNLLKRAADQINLSISFQRAPRNVVLFQIQSPAQ